MKFKKVLWVSVIFVFLFSLVGVTALAAEKIKVGFVYVGPIGDGGWTYQHDLGRKELEKAFPGKVETACVESVPEGPDAERVFESFARKGFKVIFGTSFGYMDAMLKVAKKYPNVVFMHCSGFKRTKNMGTYFGRMYQARYLSGLIAGAMTKSKKIGYVAAHPIPEVIRGINAFTLGVRKVCPDAVVKVIWTFSWYDPAKEKEAAKALIDSGCDVLAMHADSGAVPQAAEEAGVWVIGYDSDMSKFAPTRHLTAPVWHWGVVYKYVVKSVMDGTWKSEDIWWGLDKGLVGLTKISSAVPKDIVKLVNTEKERIIKGKFDVFEGPIKDQSGKIKVPAGKKMTDKELLSMKWFVEGVEGSIPK